MTRIVNVNRLLLVEKLKANREAHLKEFNEAMAGYKELALAKVDEAYQGLDAKLAKRRLEIIERINTFSAETADTFNDYFAVLDSMTAHLKVPKSYAEAYDAAIDMATFDTRDTLELSGAEFQCFCRDVWDWSAEVAATNTHYANFRK
jgi:hypothetical protein